MSLDESVTEVPIPYSKYIEYQQLQQQVAELTAGRQKDAELIALLTKQLSKDHEEAIQLRRSVKQLSRDTLRYSREGAARQEQMRGELAERDKEIAICKEEVQFLLLRKQEIEEKLRQTEEEAIRCDAQNRKLVQEAERAKEQAENAMRAMKEEVQASRLKVMEIARDDLEYEISQSLVIEGQSSELDIQQLHRTEPIDLGLLELISTIHSSSKSYRKRNDKLLLENEKLKNDLKDIQQQQSAYLATISELEEYKKTAEATIAELSREISQQASIPLYKRNSTDSKPEMSSSNNSNQALFTSMLEEKGKQARKYKLLFELQVKRMKQQSKLASQSQSLPS